MSQLLGSFLLYWAVFFIMRGPRCKRKVKENGVRASSKKSQEMSKTRTTPFPSLLLLGNKKKCVLFGEHMPVQAITWLLCVHVCVHMLV